MTIDHKNDFHRFISLRVAVELTHFPASNKMSQTSTQREKSWIELRVFACKVSGYSVNKASGITRRRFRIEMSFCRSHSFPIWSTVILRAPDPTVVITRYAKVMSKHTGSGSQSRIKRTKYDSVKYERMSHATSKTPNANKIACLLDAVSCIYTSTA